MNKQTGEYGSVVIKMEDMMFSWNDNTQPLLEIEKFDIHRGELLFVAGPSGSGKSTLLGLMTGILKPTSGDIIVSNHSLGKMRGVARDRFRVDNIGYVFQMFNLIPYLNVVENVILPCKFSNSRAKRVLDTGISLNDEAVRLLKELNLDGDTLRNKPVVELSVGQQQRVAVARALIGSPQIIIADEPTSALDAAHRQVFLDLLFSECQKTGATLVFVSHDMSLANNFDRVVKLENINKAVLTWERCND
ncbi:MAG: ABC transporter ATP-binding protein [Desulfotalea sp.]